MLKLSSNKINPVIYDEYTKYLLTKFFNFKRYNNIINNNKYFNYLSFYPLPTKLVVQYNNNDTNKIIVEDNIYSYSGTDHGFKLLFANRILPYYDKAPIPFTFPIINENNDLELLNSNIYYYELTILENHRESWEKEHISFGYGSVTTPYTISVGWCSDTFGLHLDDGTFYYNQVIFQKLFNSYRVGDTFGAGIIYLDKCKYHPFFTYNGTLIKIITDFTIKSEILPIINFNHSNKIKLNFGQEKFIFNIKNMIINNFIISHNNSFINSNYNLSKVNTETLVYNKINNLTNLTPFANFSVINNTQMQFNNLNFIISLLSE